MDEGWNYVFLLHFCRYLKEENAPSLVKIAMFIVTIRKENDPSLMKTYVYSNN
jgi:hypothetical protein